LPRLPGEHPTRVVGISADDAAAAIGATVTASGGTRYAGTTLDRAATAYAMSTTLQVGAGYGIRPMRRQTASLFAGSRA
jgi:hypothetical protein